MAAIRRCLVHAFRPERIVDSAKELVALDAEVLATVGTARVLSQAGVPVAELPSFSETSSAPHDSFQLLDPRIQGGLSGDWADRGQLEELERLGVKRIDLLLIDLPPMDGELSGVDALAELELGAVAALRAAARNHKFVIPICDLNDFGEVISALDGPEGQVSEEMRWRLARKAMQTVNRYDSNMIARSQSRGSIPDTWSVQFERLTSVKLDSEPNRRIGFFTLPQDGKDAPILRQLSGRALSSRLLSDINLAWSVVGQDPQPAVAIANHSGLCGFSRCSSSELAAAFAQARSADPRGSFGAAAAFNRELDLDSAQAISAAFLEAVAAPSYSAEAQANLGRSKTRLFQVGEGPALAPEYDSNRWGLVLRWPIGDGRINLRTVSSREPSEAEAESLRLAWSLVGHLHPVALAIVEGDRLVSSGVAQSSWRDAARVATLKLPAGVRQAVAACGHPIRFADDVAVLAERGVTAVLHPSGSPRQDEVVDRVDRLGLAMQIVEQEEAL